MNAEVFDTDVAPAAACFADAPRFTIRAVEDYRWLGDFGEAIVRALGLDPAAIAAEAHDDLPLVMAANALGLRFAHIVEEPAYRVAKDKAARDHRLGRATMHLSRQWRFPLQERGIFAAETGKPAIIVPVGNAETLVRNGTCVVEVRSSRTLSLLELGEAFEDNIADLVAIPLDGSRPLSLTGYTAAIGDFTGNVLTVYGSGKAWLDAHFARLRGLCADTPSHLAAQIHEAELFALPSGVLLVEPRAFEWRVCRFDCAVPRGVGEIVCPDSAALAQWLAAELKKPDVARDVPRVSGPDARARASSEAVAHSKRAAA